MKKEKVKKNKSQNLAFFPKNKKGTENTWWMIATVILVVVVVIVILLWFRKSGEGAFGTIDDQIIGSSDCDQDGASNMFDDCPCDPTRQDLTDEQKAQEAVGGDSSICSAQKQEECGGVDKCHKFS